VEDVGLGLGETVAVAVGETVAVAVGETVAVAVGETVAVGVGETVGVGVAVAGQVWDRLNHKTFFLPVSVFTIAEALSSTAPGAEPAYACLPVGGPKLVIVWEPPGLNVTVSETKTVKSPGRTKCHPSSVFGMLPHCPECVPKPAAVIGVG
jgi:hypothetical protein